MIVSLFLLGCVWLEWFWKKKKKVENKRENGWDWCLVGRGRRRENWWGRAIFPMGPPKLYHPKSGRKQKGKQVTHFWTIAPSQHKRSSLCLLSFLSFSWICLMLSFVSSFFLLPPLFSILCSLVFSYLSLGTLPSFFFCFLFFGMWAWFCFVFLLLPFFLKR